MTLLRFALSLVITILAVNSQAQTAPGYERSRGGILMPQNRIQAGSYSELSSFEPEFCGANEVKESKVTQICFGRVRLQSRTRLVARAFVLTDKSENKALYVESELPAVELKSLEFGIYGPLNSAGLTVAAEAGRARIAINASGEVVGLELVTEKLGRVKLSRP